MNASQSCPQCESILRPASFGEVEIDVCGACKGMFFNYQELSVLSSQKGRLPVEAAEFLSLIADVSSGKKRSCPQCDVMMSIKERYGVEIDLCQRCGGIWLDGGELSIALDFFEKEASRLKRIDDAMGDVVDRKLGTDRGGVRPALSDDPMLEIRNWGNDYRSHRVSYNDPYRREWTEPGMIFGIVSLVLSFLFDD